MSDEKLNDDILKVQYHGISSGKNYRLVIDLIKKVIEENKLKIEITECNWDKLNILKAENERLRKLLTNITKEQTFDEFEMNVEKARQALEKK